MLKIERYGNGFMATSSPRNLKERCETWAQLRQIMEHYFGLHPEYPSRTCQICKALASK